MAAAATAFIDEALVGFVEEAEEEFRARKVITDRLKELWERCKEAGYVPAIVRQMVKERAMEADARAALYRTQQNYRQALQLNLPLGDEGDEGGEVVMPFPKPFADQPVKRGRRNKAAPVLFDADHPDGAA
jgi:uncharacterized protein (UPF0335 family)